MANKHWLCGLVLLAASCSPQEAQGDDDLSIQATPPSASLPLCKTHDPNLYHGLVDRKRGCHYDHEHKDNPHALNALFGRPGAWFGGKEISFPWQTFKGAGEGYPMPPANAEYENTHKHQGYGWGVRKGLTCKLVENTGANGCLTDIRFQVHALQTMHDATTRFHSFSIEARGCIQGRCGIIREGGWIDYGRVRLDEGQPYQIDHLPLPGDPTNQPSFNPRRLHKTTQNTYQRDITWYTQATPWFKHLTWLGLRFEGWSPIDAANPFKELNYCEHMESKPKSACQWNGSWLEVHLVPIFVPKELDGKDGKLDGIVNFKGYTDRYGNIVQGCTRASLDCVPLVLQNMPVGYYQYRDDSYGIQATDYDQSPGMVHYHKTGEFLAPEHWWLKYPEYK